MEVLMHYFLRLLPLFLAACLSFPAGAAPLKIYDSDHEQFYRATTGSGSVASPYGLGVTIVDGMETSADGNTAVKVFIQDQATQPIDLLITEDKGTATTTTEAVQGGNTVDFEPGHGIVVGDVIESSTAENFVQAGIIGVATNTITVDTPWSRTFPIGTTVNVGNPNMVTVSSPASQAVFSISPSALQTIDITRIMVRIEDSSAMAFDTLGGGSAVTNGIVFRKRNADGTTTNLFNWKTNGDFIGRAFDHSFQTGVGGSTRAFIARSTWAGQSKRGVVLRINGSLGEEFEVVIQDDMTGSGIGLDLMEMVGQGHVLQQ
jgi:hypothetical protein